MAALSLTLILCADWAYNCLPLVRAHSDSGSLEADKTEKKLIGKVKVIIDISCGPVTLALVTKVQKAAKHWKYSKFGALDLNCTFTEVGFM